jgi:hypothetical protein
VSGLIVSPDGDRRDLVSAVKDGSMPAILATVREVVKLSIQSHPMPFGGPMTQAEVKHRADICVRWYERLRGDLGWPIDRVLSSLKSALTSELDGIEYVPNAEAVMYRVDEEIAPVADYLRAKPEMLSVDAARRALN